MATIRIDLPGPLQEARFVERPNRFLLHCALPRRAAEGAGSEGAGSEGTGSEGAGSTGVGLVRERSPERIVHVHMADPGRLRELLVPGRRVWIRPAGSPTRKTAWSAVLVESPDGTGLVSVDTTMPNRLVHRALAARALPELADWTLVRPEFPLGDSRIDFLLARDARRLALEVKSVTLVDDGVARFPDAITARGARHVRELAEVAGRPGWDAAILFVLQRPDAHRIEAARAIDPVFADALADARAAGVRVLGRRCLVSLDHLTLGDPVPAGPG